MKTLNKIKDELSDKYWQCTFSMAKTFIALWQLVDFMDECAKIYASQALDTAADEAKVKFNSSMAIISAKEFKINSGTYSVSKQSILNLKDQLK